MTGSVDVFKLLSMAIMRCCFALVLRTCAYAAVVDVRLMTFGRVRPRRYLRISINSIRQLSDLCQATMTVNGHLGGCATSWTG